MASFLEELKVDTTGKPIDLPRAMNFMHTPKKMNDNSVTVLVLWGLAAPGPDGQYANVRGWYGSNDLKNLGFDRLFDGVPKERKNMDDPKVVLLATPQNRGLNVVIDGITEKFIGEILIEIRNDNTQYCVNRCGQISSGNCKKNCCVLL